MSCGCKGATGAMAGFDYASNTYSPPFPGGWFWRYSWPLSKEEAAGWKPVQAGNHQVPPMYLMPIDPATKQARTPDQVEQVRRKWEAGCKSGKFVGNMNVQCAAARVRPSPVGYVAIAGAVVALGATAYLMLG